MEVRLADLLAGLSRLADVVETLFREIVGMPEPEITARSSPATCPRSRATAASDNDRIRESGGSSAT